MSETNRVDPPEHALLELFEIERRRPEPPEVMKAQVRAGVLAVAAGLGVTAAAASAAASVAKVGKAAHFLSHPLRLLIATAAVGTVAVVGGQMASQKETPNAAQPRAVVTSRPAPVAAPGIAPALPVEPGTPASLRPPRPPVVRRPAPQPPAAPAPAASAAPADSDLGVERTLLERAQKELALSRPAQALAILAMHARRFPDGRLVEERERLWIHALIAAGDYAGARDRAQVFRRNHPESIFLRDIDAAQRSIP